MKNEKLWILQRHQYIRPFGDVRYVTMITTGKKKSELGDTSCPFCNNRDTDEELAREYATDNEYDVMIVNKESKTWT